uniref:Protein Flattop n=1 Tax=Amazona collaria TaxID=241587 RepID=A0A8B9FA60_9PSIT
MGATGGNGGRRRVPGLWGGPVPVQPLPGPALPQYEDAFRAHRLQNWSRPKHSEGSTRIIANDRGHLLPSIPRSQASPWGSFLGTWEMPSRIPPARVDLTARSAAGTERLLQRIHQCPALSSARNGLRTRITGTVRAPHPPTWVRSGGSRLFPPGWGSLPPDSSRRSSLPAPLPEGTTRERGRR